MLSYIATILTAILGLFLIFIILLQRGRGGGLAGAFGGLGGQSAFGTKAGDVFTKITIVVAVIWVAMSGLSGYAHRYDWEGRFTADPSTTPSVTPGEPAIPKADADKAAGTGKSAISDELRQQLEKAIPATPPGESKATTPEAPAAPSTSGTPATPAPTGTQPSTEKPAGEKTTGDGAAAPASTPAPQDGAALPPSKPPEQGAAPK